MAEKTNNIKIRATIGTKPTVKRSRNGNLMASFFVSELFKDDSAHKRMMQDKWLRVISWDELADSAGRHLYKGKAVVLTGDVIIQQFKTRTGMIKTKQVFIANNIVIIEEELSVKH